MRLAMEVDSKRGITSMAPMEEGRRGVGGGAVEMSGVFILTILIFVRRSRPSPPPRRGRERKA